MQAKPNQRKYICPHCGKDMNCRTASTFDKDITLIYCTNDGCEVEGITWDIKKLESYECNKVQRMEELLDVD